MTNVRFNLTLPHPQSIHGFGAGTRLGTFTCPDSFVSGDVTTVAPVTCGLGPSVDITPGQTYWIVFLTSDALHGHLPFSTGGASNTGAIELMRVLCVCCVLLCGCVLCVFCFVCVRAHA